MTLVALLPILQLIKLRYNKNKTKNVQDHIPGHRWSWGVKARWASSRDLALNIGYDTGESSYNVRAEKVSGHLRLGLIVTNIFF